MSNSNGGGSGTGCLFVAAVAVLPAFLVSYWWQTFHNDLHGEAAVGPALVWTIPVAIGMAVVVGLLVWLFRRG